MKSLSFAKKYVLHRMGRSDFTENQKVATRKDQLRRLQTLYEESSKKADVFARDAARAAKSGAELAETLQRLSEGEPDPQVQQALTQYGQALAQLEQMREQMLTRLLDEFVEPLAGLQEDVKAAKNLKSKYTNAMVVYETQTSKVKDLRNKPQGQFKLPQAERELEDAKEKAERAGQDFALNVKVLEERKNSKLVYILGEAITQNAKFCKEAATALDNVTMIKPSMATEPADDGDYSLPGISTSSGSSRSGSARASTLAAPVAVSADRVAADRESVVSPTPSPVPPSAADKYVKAQYDYEASEEGELSFTAGQVITVIATDPSGWWYGELNGVEGAFPKPYCEAVSSPSG